MVDPYITILSPTQDETLNQKDWKIDWDAMRCRCDVRLYIEREDGLKISSEWWDSDAKIPPKPFVTPLAVGTYTVRMELHHNMKKIADSEKVTFTIADAADTCV